MTHDNRPLVSVVIPTRNRAALLTRAIESVLCQTYPYLDVVVVDDASQDDSASAVEVAARRDPRVRYLRHHANKGGSAARNSGIEVARGSLVAFLDDDDRWASTKIARQLEELRSYDGVLCGFALATPGRLRKGTRVRGMRSAVNRSRLRQGFYVGWGTSSILVRRRVLDEIRFDEHLPCGQDWDFVIRATECYRLGYFDERLVTIDNAGVTRISTGAESLEFAELEPRLRVLQKHRLFLGSFWYNYHAALTLLSGVRRRPDKMRSLFYAIRHYGLTAVVAGYVFRLYRDVIA